METRNSFPDQPLMKNVTKAPKVDRINHTRESVSENSALNQSFTPFILRPVAVGVHKGLAKLLVIDTAIAANYLDFLIYSPRWRRPMKSTSLLLSLFVAASSLAQSSAASQNPTEPTKQTQPPPTPHSKRLFIADYIITGAVGSAQTTNGSTYGSAAVVGRNISLEATDGFIKSCPAVTVDQR